MPNKEKGIDVKNTVGTLEIYHISISLGDTAVLVTRDPTKTTKTCPDGVIIKTVLIDLGCNHEEVLKWCKQSNSIKGFNDDKDAIFDYVIVSHNHADHIAGIQHGLLMCDHLIYSYVSNTKIFKNKLRKHKSVVDKVTAKPKLGKVKRNKEINLLDHLKVTDTKDSLYTISLAKNISLKCICANGVYLNGKGEKVVHTGNFNSWNDHSIAWLLEYQNDKDEVKFRYFTAGDLSGDSTGNYTDIESKLISYFKNKNKSITVDLLKATHHGSKHSLTKNFLKTIKPKEIIVPCNNSHLLPFPQFFERLRSLESEDTTFKPTVFIANYMHFKFSDYLKKVTLKKGKAEKDKVYKNFGTTTPVIKKVKEGKTVFLTTVDTEKQTKKRKRKKGTVKKEVKIANMKVFKTSMIKGEFKTKALETEITCEIKAPEYAGEKLPELMYNYYLFVKDKVQYSFAEESLYLAYQKTEKILGKIERKDVKKKLLNELYTLENERFYIEKHDIDEVLVDVRTELVQGFRTVFKIKPSGGKAITNREILRPNFLAFVNNNSSKKSRVYDVKMKKYKCNAKEYFDKMDGDPENLEILYKKSKDEYINPNEENSLKKRKYNGDYKQF